MSSLKMGMVFMTNPAIHRKQFLICSPDKLPMAANWPSISLSPSATLFHCPELSVYSAINPKGQQVVLLGEAIDCSGNKPPKERLMEITIENWCKVTDTWGNRWALMIGTSITTDASGMLGVYFPNAQYRRTDFAISSSSRLLGKLFPGCDKSVRGVSYAPATPLIGINCLLPGQWLDVISGQIEQPSQPIFDQIAKSHDDIKQECSEILSEFVRQVFEIERRPLWISLSGGADSRRNLAAALVAGVPFQPFSFLKKYWQTSDADRRLPRILGKRVGVETLIIDAGDYKKNENLSKAYRHHTSFRETTAPGELFYYFSGGSWEALPEMAPVIDGQNYELVSNYYYREVPPFKSAEEMLDWRFESTEETRKLTLKYLECASGGSMRDFRDFAFLLANSSVYGQMYQAMDLWCNVYVPANCRRLYSLAQSIDPEFRQDKAFWISVTNNMEPRFACIPTNPRDGLFKFLVNLFKRRGIKFMVVILMKKLKGQFGVGAGLR